MKYSVGQKVITHKFSNPRYVTPMDEYDGKADIVTNKVTEENIYMVHGWWWPEEALEPVETEATSEPPAAPDPTSLDLTKILKTGDRIYSTMQGDVKVTSVLHDSQNGIICQCLEGRLVRYYNNGRYWDKGECLLFPSRDNRDWSTFKRMPDLKKGDIVKVWDGDPTDAKIRVFLRYRDGELFSFETFNIKNDTARWGHAEKISVDELKDFE